MKVLLIAVALLLHGAAQHPRHHWPSSPKAYARQLVLRRWHSLAEWRAEDEIVTGESGWDPCAVNLGYPAHDCGYVGPDSCGIPQRDPCPAAWQGRLFATRWVQVRALQAYIAGRYGDPLNALAYHKAHGYY